MDILQFWQLPFFTPEEQAFATRFEDWVQTALLPALAGSGIALHDPSPEQPQHMATASHCRQIAALLGQGGWLAALRQRDSASVRRLCLQREILARHAPLADFVLAMQGLGAYALLLGGSAAQQAQYLPQICSGQALCAFALSESQAGSDAAQVACRAEACADGFTLRGEKCWISHGADADLCMLFARTADTPRPQHGISAFIVERASCNWQVRQEFAMLATHPLAQIGFDGQRLPASAMLGAAGQGYALALEVLAHMRSTVAAAALGMASAGLQAALTHASKRRMFGSTLAAQQLSLARFAQMQTALDGARLLLARSAWLMDLPSAQVDAQQLAVAQAKWQATEAAQQIIDAAQQMFGAAGVVAQHPLARLYREVRALRIYEGASEVQQLIIGRAMLKQQATAAQEAG